MTSYNVREIPVQCMDCDTDLRQRTDWEPVLSIRTERMLNEPLDTPVYGLSELTQARICYACLDSIERNKKACAHDNVDEYFSVCDDCGISLETELNNA